MLGYDHESFWEQTSRTLALTFAAHREVQIKEHNDRAWQAWHTAALGRTKKFSSLRSLMIKQSAPPRRVGMDEQIDSLVKWVRATGGKVVYRNG